MLSGDRMLSQPVPSVECASDVIGGALSPPQRVLSGGLGRRMHPMDGACVVHGKIHGHIELRSSVHRQQAAVFALSTLGTRTSRSVRCEPFDSDGPCC